jgi:2-polyprenyl-6-methoxyphenol hydroxylase-like FAD-dependent oxidoreductase
VQPSPHGRPPREVFSGGNVEDLEAVEAGDLHGSHARRQGAAGTSAVSRSRDPHSTEIRLAKPPDGSGTSFGGAGRITRGRMLVRLDRGDYWQCAYLVPKGGYAAVKEDGLDSFRADLAQLLPDGAVLDALQSWDDVRVLSVRVDRLTRWHQPGLLFIGDAAHAMSPIGGVGINLAVQDAAGAARLLAGPLRDGAVPPQRLAQVRWRRLLPTVVTQLVQRQIQMRVLSRILAGDQPIGTPRVLRLIDRHPVLQGLPARAIGIGVLPEHACPSLPRGVGARP